MTTTLSDNLDVFDYVRLLNLSARIAADMRPEEWRSIVEAARPAATVEQRVAALLTLAGPLTDLIEPADEQLLLRAFLPRLSVNDRNAALTLMREELTLAERFAGCSDRGDVLELVTDVAHDWVATAEQEADRHRDSARWVAREAATR